ncbi:MAG TPA: hypothetical protein VK466_15795 [Terriglobales bacterium]|nr:hypothetical protein [Terriglobales bacterium]
MADSRSIKSGIHYHIRWSDSSLDWKPFPTTEEATELAGQIKRRNENYIIVERADDCERCKMFMSESALLSLQEY